MKHHTQAQCPDNITELPIHNYGFTILTRWTQLHLGTSSTRLFFKPTWESFRALIKGPDVQLGPGVQLGPVASVELVASAMGVYTASRVSKQILYDMSVYSSDLLYQNSSSSNIENGAGRPWRLRSTTRI
jgi:hypothetical protein